MQFAFPSWVPELARARITDLYAAPWLHDDGRALLSRLATYPVMKTEVWEKLPSEPKGAEGEIIDRVVHAVTIFPRLPRPYPKAAGKWREWAKHLQNHAPLPDPAYAASLVFSLLQKIAELKPDTDANWNRLWEGDKSINVDQIFAILDRLHLFYSRLGEEYRLQLAAFPNVKRWGGDKAAQKFVTEHISNYMNATYGHPYDSIVAALVVVACDLPGGLGAETVRGRRRGVSAPEKSKRKSR
jgi:hypothetical protein